MRADEDRISVEPTLTDRHGRAWLIDTREYKSKFPASVSLWMIEAPWAHPLWHSYIISLVDLKERPTDREKPTLYFPTATHEFMLLAMNPDKPREQAFKFVNGLTLAPTNFGAQMASDDVQAAKLIEATVKEILSGDLSPDTDFTHEWVRRFGDSGMKDEYKERKN